MFSKICQPLLGTSDFFSVVQTVAHIPSHHASQRVLGFLFLICMLLGIGLLICHSRFTLTFPNYPSLKRGCQSRLGHLEESPSRQPKTTNETNEITISSSEFVFLKNIHVIGVWQKSHIFLFFYKYFIKVHYWK